jgi:glycosyltransferase involved in cell wall biosynthesis
MVRVLHVVTYMGRGGLETMLMNYYRHIDHTKVQFDFLVHRDFEADYDKEILELGGRVYHISRLIPWSQKYRKELKMFFRNHPEYKIVHVHQDCLSAVALQCAKECGIPVRIAHSHSSGAVKNLKYPIKMYYMRKIPLYATKLFACGKQAGDWMFSGKKYEIIKNAIEAEKYQYSAAIAEEVRSEFGITDEIVIGHVGNFTPAKNHIFMLEIFQKIQKKECKIKMIFVGGGERINNIRKKVYEMGMQDQIIFTGRRSDVNRLMQAMDVFIFPSLYEGVPVTMIEAQAAGLPCVISDHVPDECITTKDLVIKKRLDEPSDKWAEDILQLAQKSRTQHMEEIKKAGYDIEDAAKQLEEFYFQNGEKQWHY